MSATSSSWQGGYSHAHIVSVHCLVMLVKSNDSDSENNKSSDVTHSYSGTRTVAEASKSAASIAEARLLAIVAAAGR